MRIVGNFYYVPGRCFCFVLYYNCIIIYYIILSYYNNNGHNNNLITWTEHLLLLALIIMLTLFGRLLVLVALQPFRLVPLLLDKCFCCLRGRRVCRPGEL